MSCKTLIYETMPKDFFPQIEVAAIYVNIHDKILFLKRNLDKSEGGTWGTPAGKLEFDETPIEGAKRELFEETGIAIQEENTLQSLGLLYMRKPAVDYVYHLFALNLLYLPNIHLSTAEHQAYKWLAKNELNKFTLMSGAREALDFYYRLI